MLDKHDIQELMANLKKNEAIARKLFEIEASILSIHNFSELFENLLKLIEDKFNIPHVWLSITRNTHIARILEESVSSEYVKARLNLVDQSIFDVITRSSTEPLLANESLFYYHQLMPENCNWQLGSIAIAPLEYDGQVIGSFNQGDKSSSRFTPDLDTFFLTQLATKVSICLSNVTAQEQLQILATRDPLTHLLNRRELGTSLEREFARHQRDKAPLSLVFIDCDDFKQVNDSWGHECGDEYLVHVAKNLSAAIRQGDGAFRYAGDEFVILLPGQSLEEASIAAQRIRNGLFSEKLLYRKNEIEVKISIGIASTECPGAESPELLLKLADENLYKDKEQKHIRTYSPQDSSVR